uniref:Core domain-containing protein n=1 Tax=Arcella intermedia TaxID=1963864 RepID=A0A6B2LSV9_9EUKA
MTDAAKSRIRYLLQNNPIDQKPAKGIRVGTKAGGCNGWRYTMDFISEIPKGDEIVQDEDITVVVDPKALLAIIGTEMDYIDEDLKQEFVFNNPNASASCGCGESFSF